MAEKEEKPIPLSDTRPTGTTQSFGRTPFNKGKKKLLSTEPYKGVRDWYPEDMAVQNYIYSVWRKISEQFGYQEYAASILEPAELYRQKSGDEIVSDQMYVFTDKGGREVALRPEMTPSLARMVAAKRKSLKFPLRWYSIANMFRYERPQRGRKREHWQLNCDLLGVADTDGDVEIIKLAYDMMRAFGAKDEDFEIRINDRRILFTILRDEMELTEAEANNFVRLLDKHGKVSKEEFRDELHSLVGVEKVKKFFELTESLITEREHSALKKSIQPVNQLLELAKHLEGRGIKNTAYFPYLSRGFDYYTGMVFEVFDTNPENRRSLFGGGRFDNLLDIFGVEPVPAVGFGMGDVTIRDFLTTHG